MKTKILTAIIVSTLLYSCYTFEVELFGGTKWKYDGDVIKNEINATETVFDFISNDSLAIYENGKITDKLEYLFFVHKKTVLIDKYNLTFERIDDNLKVDVDSKSYTFKRIR